MFVSFIIPTCDRPHDLQRTLNRLGSLPAAPLARAGGGEVLVVDNASQAPVLVPSRLANGLPIAMIELESNHGAAARNVAAGLARGEWLFMLDDDSFPLDAEFTAVLASTASEVAAVGGTICLPDGHREMGGLPEVFVGCGAAIRRDAFLTVGGYDRSFQFYAEEYDLCARMLLAGHGVTHDTAIRVHHVRSTAGREMNLILERLVRNNTWVIQRYAPIKERTREIDRTLARYEMIALKEGATEGFERGRAAMEDSLSQQPVRRMPEALWDRFTGRAAVRTTIERRHAELVDRSVAIIEPGKHVNIVEQELARIGAEIVDEAEAEAEVLIVGTLSPGPMLDALERRCDGVHPVLIPWAPRGREQDTGLLRRATIEACRA